jgi:hypothetical protein
MMRGESGSEKKARKAQNPKIRRLTIKVVSGDDYPGWFEHVLEEGYTARIEWMFHGGGLGVITCLQYELVDGVLVVSRSGKDLQVQEIPEDPRWERSAETVEAEEGDDL